MARNRDDPARADPRVGVVVRRGYDSGPACRVCGKYRINVDHDGPMERARNIEVWAMPSPGMGGKDYYEWAGVEYHPFEPAVPETEPGRAVLRDYRTDYERGYQAGYHAGMRRAEKVGADS